MKLSIIIISFNSLQLLRECLRSLFAEPVDFDSEVIVVDNASSDGSTDMVRAEFPQVQLLENSENVGFAAANNIGAGRARGQLLLLLNSDAQLTMGAVKELVAFMERQPAAGVSGPRLTYPDGAWQPNGLAFPTFWSWLAEVSGLTSQSSPKRLVPTPVDVVSGACMMVRRAAWEALGGFDDGFFFYWEDYDLCRRIWAHGWEVWYCPQAHIVHLAGGSSTLVRSMTRDAASESTLRYFRKHHSRCVLLAVLAVLVLREIMRMGQGMVSRRKTPRHNPFAQLLSRFAAVQRLEAPHPKRGQGE
ncbi:MAG: hypothetical protein AUJ92_19630 [Armatimonadetes bacterium CG2_30_59_28]|nr:glycosyltransferase family 2 protein [Armatimonadota bacterium]OIO90023.1 MAG: hypothetical protein AUJ92_19630 [Armatimonadetes bacterium CG2_30_59_28]PIU60488.1 MAG: glycosyltransferase family 2 protein [Armatimonadetes bacterium CG07_land_8_20_14_0_80_59_28]PIX43334.1 MAG: glycosyltransferase family 2 protein [Armatimonadetes bacterium CG_4_8_14_3_um_filter_58_9]PIY49354.1 MAG: glycosyltransferase family 2 protein [Armatimonadetes bacterium CG_4_10_14_3_um_filter_59_10]PJB68859.1 MAG: gl